MKLQNKIFFIGLLILMVDLCASNLTALAEKPVTVVEPKSSKLDYRRNLEAELKNDYEAKQHKMPAELQTRENAKKDYEVKQQQAIENKAREAKLKSVAELNAKNAEKAQRESKTQAIEASSNQSFFNYVRDKNGLSLPIEGLATREGVAPENLNIKKIDPAKPMSAEGIDLGKTRKLSVVDNSEYNNAQNQVLAELEKKAALVKGPEQSQKAHVIDPLKNYNRATMSVPMEEYIAPLQAKYPNATSEQLQEYVQLVLAKEQSGQSPTGLQLVVRKKNNPYPILEPNNVAEYNPRWPEQKSDGDLRSEPTGLQQLYKDLNESSNKQFVRSEQSNGVKEVALNEKASGGAIDTSSSQPSLKVAEQQPQAVDLNHVKVVNPRVDNPHASRAAVPVVLAVAQNPANGLEGSFKSSLTLPKIDDTPGAVENLYNAIDVRPVEKKGWIYGTSTTSVTAEQITSSINKKNKVFDIQKSYENRYNNQEAAFIALNKDIIALEDKIPTIQDNSMQASLEKLKTNAEIASNAMNKEIIAAKVQDLLSQLLPASQEISIQRALNDFAIDRANINNQIKGLSKTDPVAIKIEAQYKAVYRKVHNLLEIIERNVENLELQLNNLTSEMAKNKINKELKPFADRELDKAKRDNRSDQSEVTQEQYFLANQKVEQLKLILKLKGQDSQALKNVKVEANAIATNLIKDEVIKYNKKDIQLDPFKIGLPILIDKLVSDKVVQGQDNLQQEKMREFLKEYKADPNYNINHAFEKLNELAQDEAFKNINNEQFGKTLELYTQVINELYLKILKHESNKKVVEKYIQGLEKNKLSLSKNMQNIKTMIAELEKIPENNRKEQITEKQQEEFNKFVDIKKISEKTTVAELLELYEGVRDKLLEEHNKTSLQKLFNKLSAAIDNIRAKEYKTGAKAAGTGVLQVPGATVEVVGALASHVVDAFKVMGLDWDELPQELKVTITLTLITAVAGYFGIIQANNNMNPDEKKKMQQDLLTAFAQDVATTAIAYKTGANYDAVASGDLTLIGTSAAINKLVPSDPNYRATNTVSTTNLDNFKAKYGDVLNSSTYQPPVYGNVSGSPYSNSYRPGAYAAA